MAPYRACVVARDTARSIGVLRSKAILKEVKFEEEARMLETVRRRKQTHGRQFFASRKNPFAQRF